MEVGFLHLLPIELANQAQRSLRSLTSIWRAIRVLLSTNCK